MDGEPKSIGRQTELERDGDLERIADQVSTYDGPQKPVASLAERGQQDQRQDDEQDRIPTPKLDRTDRKRP